MQRATCTFTTGKLASVCMATSFCVISCLLLIFESISCILCVCVCVCRTIENPRMVVRKIRFAPGKGNSKILVLYTTRLEIRDTTSVRVPIIHDGWIKKCVCVCVGLCD